MPKDTVVSFRLNDEQFGSLNEVLQKDTPTGVNSENQQARKIVIDYLAGRLKVQKRKTPQAGHGTVPGLKVDACSHPWTDSA
jgi:hypothetical protein